MHGLFPIQTKYGKISICKEIDCDGISCPTIPLPRETKGYQGIFTGKAGPRVGYLTFLCTLM